MDQGAWAIHGLRMQGGISAAQAVGASDRLHHDGCGRWPWHLAARHSTKISGGIATYRRAGSIGGAAGDSMLLFQLE
jgi:hypothetical protein